MLKMTLKMQTMITSPLRLRAPGGRDVVRFGIACLLMVAVHGLSLAHVQKTAVTRILFNANTHNMEVMHRLLLHDAEHAATLIFGEQLNLLESEESRELFSNYVMNRFAIEAGVNGGRPELLKLKYVGSEIDGQYLWVYQEIAEIPELTSLTVVHSVLRDIWPDQSNLVNIERADQIYTLNFTANSDVLSVEF